MTFNTIEVSEYFEPIELYTFSRGSTKWYFTSADRDITFLGKVYLKTPMKRGRIESTQDIGKTPLKIETSIRNPFVTQYIASSPTAIIDVTIQRIHAADADPSTTFVGRVINVTFKENEVTILCQSVQSSLRRPGLRRLYQTTCPHVLYGGGCGVVRSVFLTTAVLSAVSGLDLTSSSFIISVDVVFDANWFVGGYVEVSSGGLVSTRFITAHDNVNGILTLNLPLPTAVVGTTVDAHPGCDHANSTCGAKFSNIENYGGFPFIPEKNPMDGTSVF